MRQLILILFVLLIPRLVHAEGGVFAVVIGNNAPPVADPTLGRLRYSDDDAVRFRQLLMHRAERTWLLSVLDADTQKRHGDAAEAARVPTRAALVRVVGEVRDAITAAKESGQSTEVYFVFSGHGASTSTGVPYLALHDDILTRDALYDEILAAWPADLVHLVIDACNAGAMVGARGPFDRTIEAERVEVAPSEARTVVEAASLSRFPNVGAIVATTEGREAHEWSRIESGVFTHEILSGALGAADINGDRAVEYSELLAFVSSANSRVADPRTKPRVIAIPPAVNQRAPWIRLDRLTNVVRVRGRAANLGRFFVELENGQRYLDAHLAPDERVDFVLPPGVLAQLRTSAFELDLDTRDRSSIELDLAKRRPNSVASRGAADASFRKSLFAAPFGRTYYRGFVDSRSLVGVPTDDLTVASTQTSDGVPAAAWVSFSVAGVALAATIVTSVLAVDAKKKFDATDIRQEAMELSARYDRYVALSLTSAVVTAAATGVGIWIVATDDDGPALASGFGGGVFYTARF